jgi:hypothetical protein
MKELIENTFVVIVGLILFFGIWLVIGMLLTTWLSRYEWYKKIKYIYKFEIPKKYQTKVSPIYELSEDDWNGGMLIRKWSLRYYEKERHQILSLFLFYPIEFLTYGYQIEDTVFVCKKKDVDSIVGTLEENYERIWGKENAEYLREKEIKDQQKQRIKDLNQVFDENYE